MAPHSMHPVTPCKVVGVRMGYAAIETKSKQIMESDASPGLASSCQAGQPIHACMGNR